MLCTWVIVFSTDPTPLSTTVCTYDVSTSFSFLSNCFTLWTSFCFNFLSECFHVFSYFFTRLIRMPRLNAVCTKLKPTSTYRLLFSSDSSFKSHCVCAAWFRTPLTVRIFWNIPNAFQLIVLYWILLWKISKDEILINFILTRRTLYRNFSSIRKTVQQILSPTLFAKRMIWITRQSHHIYHVDIL